MDRKEPAIAVLLGFLWAGAGHIYVGGNETNKGIGLAVGYLVAIMFSVILIGLPFVLGLWIYGMVNANTAAVEHNRRLGLS